ncbi:MAG: YceI family protein [Cocleimonas sp.]
MRNIKNTFEIFVLSLALALSQATFAAAHEKKVMGEMKLDNALSALSFVSIKKGTVGEAHSINNLSGSISPEGNISVVLDLSSVDTKIDIRNDRMKKHLFETSANPTATITAKVGNKISVAGVSIVEGEVSINLHGTTKTVPVSVAVINTGSQVVISSTKPIIIKADDYGMAEGVAMLQKLAKLPSIATAVPVNFVLTFSK